MDNPFRVQSTPAATTLTTVYTVPATAGSPSANVVMGIWTVLAVANRSATAQTFRLSLAVGGAANSTAQYLFYDFPLPPNDTLIRSMTFPILPADVIRAYVSDAQVTFNVAGLLVT